MHINDYLSQLRQGRDGAADAGAQETAP
jgi:hypothetical protein